MSEENQNQNQNQGGNAIDQVTPAVTWENSPIAQIYNPDGSQREGASEAMKALGFEDLAGTTLRNNAGFFDSAKQHKDAKSQLTAAQQAKGLTVPGEGASDEQIADFKRAIGANGTAEDYVKNMYPENLPADFKKDESLQALLSGWAANNPVNTPASVQALTQGFIDYQTQTVQAQQEAQQAESDKVIQETRKTLTSELGGEKAFADFSSAAKTYLVSDDAKSKGFDFKADAEGKLSTDNPLHSAMLNDTAFLRMLGEQAKKVNPMVIPGATPAQGGGSPDANEARRKELIASNPGGFSNQADLDEYNSLSGRS